MSSRSLRFSDLPGFADDDHSAAFAAFLRSAHQIVNAGVRERKLTGARLTVAAEAALEWTDTPKKFFEQNFSPVEFGPGTGHITGFYEPRLLASLTQTAEFPVPLLKRPPDLVDRGTLPLAAGTDVGTRYGRQIGGELHPYENRALIEASFDRFEPLAWVSSSVEAFFVHVQGAALLTPSNGTDIEVTYAAKSGHPYVSIGRVLAERLNVSRETMTADRLRGWLNEHPDDAEALMQENPSFIFFRENDTDRGAGDGPVAAGKVRLTPGRSVAVDRVLHSFGIPFWLEPSADITPRLTIAQDTGSAIVGPSRVDLFTGTGPKAGLTAGRINSHCRCVAMVPV